VVSGLANQKSPDIFSTTGKNFITSLYVEYAFDSGEDKDLGFTKQAYDKIKNTYELPDAGSLVIKDSYMSFSEISLKDIKEGIIERRIWGNDRYELAQQSGEGVLGRYKMLENGNLIFEHKMNFGSDGPISDWRMVNGKPAFTFRTSCPTDIGNKSVCNFDIWYDGTLISEKYAVKNPQYLFAYKGKIGFVALNKGLEAIFYDGKFITPTFDFIWTHNCCSYIEILPTIFENGTLLFYAKRGETTYLVETLLNNDK
jgi:hypothetical protein